MCAHVTNYMYMYTHRKFCVLLSWLVTLYMYMYMYTCRLKLYHQLLNNYAL